MEVNKDGTATVRSLAGTFFLFRRKYETTHR
jgi:hypothetical protein